MCVCLSEVTSELERKEKQEEDSVWNDESDVKYLRAGYGYLDLCVKYVCDVCVMICV